MKKNKYELFPNPNGVVYKITIDKKCCKCGACMGFSDMFDDSDTGMPYLNHRGLFTSELKDLIDDVADICPVSAIAYNSVSTVKSSLKPTLNELKSNVYNKICNYEFQKPDYEDYSWNCYGISLDWGSCVSYDDYSSISSARSAGFEQVDNKYFKKADALCTEVLSEFKNTRLRPLLDYNDDRGNYYHEHEQDVNAYLFVLLNEIFNVSGYNFIEDTNFYPVVLYNRSDKTEFASFERNYRYLQRDVRSKEFYKSYIECDSYETLVETRIFNRLKEKKTYSYNIFEALNRIEDHIRENSKENIREAFYNTWSSQKYDLSEYEDNLKKIGNEILDVLKGNTNYKKSNKTNCNGAYSSLTSLLVGSIMADLNNAEEKSEEELTEVMNIEGHFLITGRGTVLIGQVKNKKIQVKDEVIINGKRYIVSEIEAVRSTILDYADPGIDVWLFVDGLERGNVFAGDTVYLVED